MSPSSSRARQGSAGSGERMRLMDNESVSLQSAPTCVTSRRVATVYDAVAGRVGLNGFLTQDQLRSGTHPSSKPEEVLLRRVGAPDKISHDFYNVAERLSSDQKLPDSDLLKAVHAYASDYYAAATEDGGQIDFRSFDETALLALGILLEEASKEVLGENGDMVLVEPEGLENGLPESESTKHQLIGRVKSKAVQRVESEEEDTDELERDGSPRKKRR